MGQKAKCEIRTWFEAFHKNSLNALCDLLHIQILWETQPPSGWYRPELLLTQNMANTSLPIRLSPRKPSPTTFTNLNTLEFTLTR